MKTRFIIAVAQLEFSEQIRGENKAPGEKTGLCVWLPLPTQELSFKDYLCLYLEGLLLLSSMGTQWRPGLGNQLYK